ncbi:MAG TPA: hypothetical protein VKR06_37720 [Ktedonosporobacter sp.]|nr:hypothetical protein [Ktedonosporobacter sp.]
MRLKVARIKLREIVTRANEDPKYMETLRCNPITVLVEEGLPYDAIEDFLREAGLQAEVSGYAIPECANTCALTNVDPFS